MIEVERRYGVQSGGERGWGIETTHGDWQVYHAKLNGEREINARDRERERGGKEDEREEGKEDGDIASDEERRW